jgi:hypothetical protein
MSFASPPSFQPDKDSDCYGQSYVDPCKDLFDQFLDFDNLDNASSTFPGSTFLVKSNSGTDAGGAGPSSRDDQSMHQVKSESLKRGEPDYKKTIASPQRKSVQGNLHFEGLSRAAISESELLSLEGISLRSPNPGAQPHTPSLSSTPAFPLTPATTGHRHRILDIPKSRSNRKTSSTHRRTSLHHTKASQDPETQRSPIRKVTSPAKMMRAQQYNEQTLNEWSQRLAVEAKGFQFDFHNGGQPLSPPPSARVSDASTDSHAMIPTVESHNGFVWDNPVPQYSSRSQGEIHTPIPTPTDGTYSFHSNQNMSQSSDGMIAPNQNPSSSWAQTAQEYAFSTTPYTEEDAAPSWWSHTAAASMAQASPASFHRNIGAGSLQNTKTLAMQLQNELAYNANELALSPSNMPSGLMLTNIPTSPMPQSFVVASSPMGNIGPSGSAGYFGPASSHRYTLSHSMNTSPHGPSAFANPMQSRKTPSFSSEPSDSPSPTSGTSSHSQAFHVQKRRQVSRRHTEHGIRTVSRTASMSRVGGARASKPGSGIDFVNFTPSDSGKILSGVAPSGSSKTKARREKEAMEKRRKLSMAAMRAVQAAGGSIEGLVEEGLLV